MEKGKKGLILKTLERCRSLGYQRSSSKKHRRVPEGYFTVCVGAYKDRFMIKMECMNHPLFKLLLDEAEMEYGFSTEGPLELPCDVDLFDQLLWEMGQEFIGSPRCRSFTASPIRAGYRILSPSMMDRAGYRIFSP